MNIVLGSKNVSKRESIVIALNELGIYDYNILCVDANSNVSSKPINEETLTGAKNRNRNLLEYCDKNNIDFDILISIEGGYEKQGSNYFIVTYTSVINKDRQEFVGMSQGLEISERMYEWVKSGKSLNKVIESIDGCINNKKGNGISGFLTDGYYKRTNFDSSAVISALVSMNNYEKYKKLDMNLKKWLIILEESIKISEKRG